MASVRQIRGRIRSVRNTARVTHAMQMVAASKMRRAQERVMGARPYAEKLQAVLADLVAHGAAAGTPHPLLVRRPVNARLLVVISPDRGLAGGMPGNINRRAGRFLLEQDTPTPVITVGRKGRDFMVRAGRDLRASFMDLGDRPTLADTLPISHMISQMYEEGAVDEVHLAYTRFVNTITQQPEMLQLLPIDPAAFGVEDDARPVDYIFEPDPASVFGELLPRFMEIEVYRAILENAASEQSARMVAMRSATDNANEMVDQLTLDLNKARQGAITSELLDIVGGVAALEG